MVWRLACKLLVLPGDVAKSIHGTQISHGPLEQVFTGDTLEPKGRLPGVRSQDNRFVLSLFSPLAVCLSLPKSHRLSTSGLTSSTEPSMFEIYCEEGREHRLG